MLQPIDETAEENERLSVFDTVLGAFFHKLEQNPEFLEIAARLKKETNYSEINIRRSLFGDDE